MPSHSINVAEEEKTLEKILKDKIAGIRRNDGGNLSTNWDGQLSYLLQTALSNYEFERVSKYHYFEKLTHKILQVDRPTQTTNFKQVLKTMFRKDIHLRRSQSSLPISTRSEWSTTSTAAKLEKK